MRSFVEWLDTHAWSTALHESLHMYPIVETTHVLSLMVFVGTLAIVDFRLLGVAFRNVPVSQVTSRVLPWTALGFVVIVSTGVMLFYAIPIRTFHSVWFRLKVILIVAAGINAWLLHRRMTRTRVEWDNDRKPPLLVRMSAGVSLAAWAGVIICGRMIAYNWFDCDKPQPAWVNFLAGCIAEAAVP
ncbi:MAG: hypothetical protein OXG08_09795 [Gammaproteobacteria bacterium]|nr:hypothetical protein [Gammaproteobacteria bacterium]